MGGGGGGAVRRTRQHADSLLWFPISNQNEKVCRDPVNKPYPNISRNRSHFVAFPIYPGIMGGGPGVFAG